MVSYYNHVAMYRQQAAVMPPQTHFNNNGSSPTSWYNPYNNTGHQHHQMLNCMQENSQEPTNPHTWHPSMFHHNHNDYIDQKYLLPHQLPHGIHPQTHPGYDGPPGGPNGPHEPPPQLPSPPMSVSELSSPGNLTPPQGQTRPPAIRSPFDWINKPNYQTQPNPETQSSAMLLEFSSSQDSHGKTRTKDKYRVVYTDHQRLELEKEFHFTRYITIRRKSELAANLGLSERQVKIWFQNRRAKERKQVKKRDELNHKDASVCQNVTNQFTQSPVPNPQQIHQQTMLHHQQNLSNMPIPLI